jgi:prepilin-type N-terminal cleavage/methylation domain-containing protein
MTTLSIGMRKNNPGEFEGAFTLIELIFVMALLATILAFSAPALSRSFRERHLQEEAVRFLALTEYGRNEAVSQGVPMVIWVEAAASRFGLVAADGYNVDQTRRREYVLNPDIRIELTGGTTSRGVSHVIEFTPDGTPNPLSTASLRLIDRFDSVLTIARTSDGWGYEIVKEAR